MTKPEVEFIPGPAPTELQIIDLVVGDGDEAVPGGVVDVHYVGVEFDSGEEFDSSWNRGQSARFPLPQLIGAWQEGIPGMGVQVPPRTRKGVERYERLYSQPTARPDLASVKSLTRC